MIGRVLTGILGLIGVLGGTLLVLDGGYVPMTIGLLNAAGGAGVTLWAIMEREKPECPCREDDRE